MADAIVSRSKSDFESNLVKVLDCDELLGWLSEDFRLSYDEVKL